MIQRDYNKDIKIIENHIFKYFTSIDEYQKKVYESMLYSLSSGGKRVRPLMAVMVYRSIAGEDYTKVLPFATAIEMIHTYSLIHDDLPAMDDDDIRRGKPTNHKVFSEAIAILAGDGLLNMATEVLARELESIEDIEELKRALKAMRYMFTASGVHGMVGGQVIDLGFSEVRNLEVCETMYKLKTAALIRAAVVSAAIIAGANDEEITEFEEFANSLGMAYQMRDDILDAKDDIEKDNNTILNYINVEELKTRVDEYSERAMVALGKLKYDTEELEELTKSLVKRNY
ncbi:geranylgeranyl diphosphate synthase, type II [Peptoniphilus asaccharolyticus DSM 20463]|uniref:Farnesyl diphosphate synthase n=1 Tax=Peptoniphilus asaccharolyticus DSM 20463 TaxID=573058 RepID=A0A1W1UMZ0_PEPAS|nr:polyprenyl synthetase family protein [Peptoniphilus asaccharolyticus]MBL7574941.1 polyprenyl synthetase family protein [Peptoniphilus asaccharolyticus]SMB82440.1 geranylgeranyl diphosphate synthase, type II [Peptoniphilus asaccharolyticus DSM 20463]